MKRRLTLLMAMFGMMSLSGWAGINPDVMEVDLDIEGIDDPLDMSPGGYVCVEGHAKIITLKIKAADWQGPGRLTWDKALKIQVLDPEGEEIENGRLFHEVVGLDEGIELYVVGIEASDSPADVEMMLEGLHCAPGMYDTVAFTVLKVELERSLAGNRPDLEPGRICINAQPEYKKAKWKAIVKPSGTATVTPVSGGITVIGGAGLSDEGAFWVEGGTVIGDYEIKIAHDSLLGCSITKGEKVFKFVKEERSSPKNVTQDFVKKGNTQYGPPSYYSSDLKNVNNCTDSSVDFENIAHESFLMEDQNCEFTVIIGGTFGVKTDPVALYTGEVKAKLSCTWSGSIHAESRSTAGYHMGFEVDGAMLDHPRKSEATMGETISLSGTDSKDGVQFTTGAMDGGIVSPGCHGCAQKGPFNSDEDAMVDGSHVIDLTDFQVVP